MPFRAILSQSSAPGYGTTYSYIFHLDIKKSPRTAAPPPSRRMISDRRMTPDPLDGLKRKKVKVLLRKMIPAPLLSHISSDEDIEERFSTTPMTVKKEHSNIQVNILSVFLLVKGSAAESLKDFFLGILKRAFFVG